MPRERLPLTLCVWGCMCCSSAFAQVGNEAESRFSQAELSRLERGELLTRATSERAGNTPLTGGTSWQVIDRPPDAVWSLLLDASQYVRTLPQVSRALVVEERGPDRTIYLEHGNALLQLSYYLKIRVDAPSRRITFRVDESRPHDIHSGAGFYWVRPYGAQRTLLVYGVLADLGDRLLAVLMRANVQEWMMKVPWLIKRVAEAPG
jgi:hypothetical protein